MALAVTCIMGAGVVPTGRRHPSSLLERDVPVSEGRCHVLLDNPDRLDTTRFCDSSEGCWPALWLLGAQKAATSAVFDVLEHCGIATGAWPTPEQTGSLVPSWCSVRSGGRHGEPSSSSSSSSSSSRTHRANPTPVDTGILV